MVKQLPERRFAVMREEETPKAAQAPDEKLNTAHPWLDLTGEDDSIGEPVRCSLDEIRYA